MDMQSFMRSVMNARLEGVNVAMPARVEGYDAGARTVDVQPMTRRLVLTSDGAREPEDLPVIPDVPVLFPGGGGFHVSLPIAVGDFVLLVFANQSISQWRETGEAAAPVDAAMHALSNAVAIPGLYPATASAGDASNENLVLGKNGGATISITPTLVNLGEASAASFVALATKVDTAVTTIVNAFNTHTHPETGSTTSPPSVPIAPVPDSVAATKVKAT
jgi:hypothetical protein